MSLILLEDLNATLLKYYLIMFADICMECEYCYKPQFFRMTLNLKFLIFLVYFYKSNFQITIIMIKKYKEVYKYYILRKT